MRPDDTGLLRYQLAKLERAADGDVLLLGDSSLGNAVDASGWSEALGRPVWNAALTGEFGYEGTLGLLRRALRRFDPALVVVFHSLEIPSREPEWKGMLYTAESWRDLDEAPLHALLPPLLDVGVPARALARLVAGPRPPPAALVAEDYVPQRPRRPERIVGRRLDPDDIEPAAIALLERIGALCRAADVPCVYAHGPYVEPACSANAPYLAAVDARIEAAGLPVVPGTPYCLSRAEVGDSEDHVAPALEAAVSRSYRLRVSAVASIGPGPAAARPARAPRGGASPTE